MKPNKLVDTETWGARISKLAVPAITRFPFLQWPWNRLCAITRGYFHFIYSPQHMLLHLQNTVSEEDLRSLVREQIEITDKLIARLRPGQPEVVELLQYLKIQLVEFPGARNATIWMQEVNKLQTTADWIPEAEIEHQA